MSLPALVIERVGPGATVQARPRVSARRWAVPAGGPLDRATFAKTVAAVGGALGDGADDGLAETALELPLHRAFVRLDDVAPRRVSIDGVVRIVLPGETIELAPAARAVRYLAVAGGLDVPEVLGSRGTSLPAGIGGFEGRMLRAGDRVPLGPAADPEHAMEARARGEAETDVDDDERPLAAMVVPASGVAPHALFERIFSIDPRSDRIGTRLLGAPYSDVPPALGRSRPMVRGAVQLPPGGAPIVLGPDAPTLGGYPVIAVLLDEAIDALARRRPGRTVRFVRVD